MWATGSIKEGEIIGLYGSKLCLRTDAISSYGDSMWLIDLELDYEGPELCFCSHKLGNLFRLMRPSDDVPPRTANVSPLVIWWDRRPYLCLQAVVDIDVGTELVYEWGVECHVSRLADMLNSAAVASHCLHSRLAQLTNAFGPSSGALPKWDQPDLATLDVVVDRGSRVVFEWSEAERVWVFERGIGATTPGGNAVTTAASPGSAWTKDAVRLPGHEASSIRPEWLADKGHERRWKELLALGKKLPSGVRAEMDNRLCSPARWLTAPCRDPVVLVATQDFAPHTPLLISTGKRTNVEGCYSFALPTPPHPYLETLQCRAHLCLVPELTVSPVMVVDCEKAITRGSRIFCGASVVDMFATVRKLRDLLTDHLKYWFHGIARLAQLETRLAALGILSQFPLQKLRTRTLDPAGDLDTAFEYVPKMYPPNLLDWNLARWPICHIVGVLATRGRGKNAECLVQWDGTDPSWNAWLPSSGVGTEEESHLKVLVGSFKPRRGPNAVKTKWRDRFLASCVSEHSNDGGVGPAGIILTGLDPVYAPPRKASHHPLNHHYHRRNDEGLGSPRRQVASVPKGAESEDADAAYDDDDQEGEQKKGHVVSSPSFSSSSHVHNTRRRESPPPAPAPPPRPEKQDEQPPKKARTTTHDKDMLLSCVSSSSADSSLLSDGQTLTSRLVELHLESYQQLVALGVLKWDPGLVASLEAAAARDKNK